jgi:hypothetical protein
MDLRHFAISISHYEITRIFLVYFIGRLSSGSYKIYEDFRCFFDYLFL